jgi:glycosyltransferase involved in cell wall biosynthesis
VSSPVSLVPDPSPASGRRLRVLLTNTALETRGGSELYLLDVACWLRDQGHAPVLYSARLGPLAETIRQHALPVIDDLARLADPPQVIHAQHHLPAMAALARFPHTPTVFFCHGWLPWEEAPLRHPAIRRYVAVSGATRERLVAEHAVPPGRVHTIPNFVDTRRFPPRDPLPARPRRALVFSNQAVEGRWVETLRHVCIERGIQVDVAGWRSGHPLDRPEEVLGAYDLVFARGRSALEAMAVGCGVVLCDAEGLGPMVTPDNLDHLGAGNFGMQVLRDAHRAELFRRAIDAYDAGSAARVSALVRETRALERVVPHVFAAYEEALADHAAAPHSVDEADAAAGAYVIWLHREFPVPWLGQRKAYARTLVDAEARSRDLSAEAEHLRGVVTAQRHAADEAARVADARVEAERAALMAAHQAALDAAARESERQATERLAEAVVEAERAVTARLEVEHAARMGAEQAAHQAALDTWAATLARQHDDIARLTAEVSDLRATLAHIRGGFLFRRALTPLWKARLQLLPEGSARYRSYCRARMALGRLAGLVAPRHRTPAAVDSAEVATEVPSDATLAAVVMDVGGRPETVEAVASLLAQTPRPEVVVVSSGGGDLDQRIARAGHDVTVVQVSRVLMPGATRNVGLAASDAPWVGFLAGDSLARAGWAAGRLAAHAAGAEAVSSAVVNHARWNPFSAAAHCLLLSYRLPGVAPSRRLHYGASYARTLFAKFGAFRHDLRTGEDTELRERFAGRVRFAFRGDVQVAHRNPTSLASLLSDQFHRGRRTVRAREALYPGPARALVARVSLTRVPRSLWISLASTPVREWGPILWGLPWLVPGALAYAAGAATSRSRSEPVASPAGGDVPASPRPGAGRTRVICVTPFRNERRYLPDFLANVAPQVDGIIAVDDGSVDGSGDIVAAHPSVLEVIRIAPREPHRWNELRNRRLLVDAAGRYGAEWVIALDADERLERGFRDRMERIIAGAGSDGPQAYAVTFREMWDAPGQYRMDGVWGRKRSARLFRLRPDHDFGSRALHGHWAPENSRGPDGAFVLADLIVYHLRMIEAADRERRMRRYLALDPDRRWQAVGYEYLVDTTGLMVETLPPGREYEPLAQPATEAPDERLEPVAVAGRGTL